jgi:hypothetical protein
VAAAWLSNSNVTLSKRRMRTNISTEGCEHNEKIRHIINYMHNIEALLDTFDAILPCIPQYCDRFASNFGFDINIALPGCEEETQLSSFVIDLDHCCALLIVNPTSNSLYFVDIVHDNEIWIAPYSFAMVNAKHKLIHPANTTCESQVWLSTCITEFDSFKSAIAKENGMVVDENVPYNIAQKCKIPMQYDDGRKYECNQCFKVDSGHYPLCKLCLPTVHPLFFSKISTENGLVLVASKHVRTGTQLFREQITGNYFELLTDNQWYQRHKGFCSHVKYRIPLTGTEFVCDQTNTRGLSSMLLMAASGANCQLTVDRNSHGIFICCFATRDIDIGTELCRDIVIH